MRTADLGFGEQPPPPGPLLPFPPVYTAPPPMTPMAGAYAPIPPDLPPLRVMAWRWDGRPELFDALDTNGDGAVDEHELERGLGRGLLLLRGQAAGPLDEDGWAGARKAFRLVDADDDGQVTRAEVAQALGRYAVQLAHGHPAHGPALPEGAAYAWSGVARSVVFPNRQAKARYMADAAIHDASDPQVISWAQQQFVPVPEDKRAAAILRFCQNDIRYERDPAWFDDDGVRHGIELLDSSPVGFFRGYGDCDLKARMFVALCRAAGLDAVIEPVFEGRNGFPHVRARVRPFGTETAGSWDARPRPAWRRAAWSPDTADPTIVNSTIGHAPRGNTLTAWPHGEPPPALVGA